jgi:hypothetical protein
VVEVKAKSGGGAVAVVAGWAAPLAVCWVFAYGAGSGNWLDGWAIAIAIGGVAGVTALAWLLSKISHGGDWALRNHERLPHADQASKVSEVVG